MKNQVVRHIPVLLVIVMVFIMGLQENYSPDLGFHLRSACEILEHGFIYTDTFTYTSFGNPYYDFQWLYQLLVFMIYKNGIGLLIVINSLLITLSFWFLYLRSKALGPAKFNSSFFLAVSVIAIQALPFEIRPHVFSWMFLNLCLALLENYKENGERKKLRLIPVIILVWMNMHSLAVLGLAALVIFTCGIYLEKKKWDKNLLVITFFSMAALCITPYFFNGLLFPLKQFGIIGGTSDVKLYIAEMQSPFTFSELKQQGIRYLLNPLFYLQLYAVLALFAARKLYAAKEKTAALLIACFFIIFFIALKNYGYFVIVSLPYLIQYLQTRWIIKSSPKKRKLQLTVSAIAAIITWTSITDGYNIIRASPYRSGLSEDKLSIPVEAARFLKENNIRGHLLNHLDFGGYLMFHLHEQVFIDGRMELPSPIFFEKYFNSLKPGGLAALLGEYDPDIIVFPYMKATGWWQYLMRSNAYRAIYFDGLSVIYLKNGKYDSVTALDKDKAKPGLQAPELSNLESLVRSEKPSVFGAFVQSFWKHQYYPLEEQNKASFCFTMGFFDAALQYSAEGLKKATVNPKGIFYNLYIYFNKKRVPGLAQYCLKRSNQ